MFKVNRSTLSATMALAAAAAFLAACGSSSGGSSTTTGAGAASTVASSPAGPSSGAAAAGSISTATGTAGTYLVDSKGLAIYILTSDKPNGASACTTQCLQFWPPVAGSDPAPTVSGVSAKLGTFKAADGSTELTVNGYPAYTFANDKAPGDTHGQGVKSFGGVWWLVKPSGDWITASGGASTAPSSSASSKSGGGGYGY